MDDSNRTQINRTLQERAEASAEADGAVLGMARYMGNQALLEHGGCLAAAKTAVYGNQLGLGQEPVPVVQRLRIEELPDGGYASPPSESAEKVIDTDVLAPEELRGLIIKLLDKKYTQILDDFYKEKDQKGPKAPDLGQLTQAAARLKVKDAASALPEIAQTQALLKAAQEYIAENPRHPHFDAYFDACILLNREIIRICGVHNVAPDGVEITPEAVNDYRAEIQTDGVYGGLAEAETAAGRLGITIPIYRINNNGSGLIHVVDAGQGPRRGNWGVLHAGLHYVAVETTGAAAPVAGPASGAAPASAPGAAVGIGIARIVQTVTDGNCLYHAMLLVNGNGHDAADLPARIAALRQEVSTSITDEMIQESLLEMIVLNDAAGAGTKTSSFLSSASSVRTSKPQLPEGGLQSMLTSEYWEKLLKEAGGRPGGTAAANPYAETQAPDFWAKVDGGGSGGGRGKQKGKKKAAAARNLNTVLTTVAPPLLRELSKRADDGQLKVYKGMNSGLAAKLLEVFNSRNFTQLQTELAAYSEQEQQTSKNMRLAHSLELPRMGHLGNRKMASGYCKKPDEVLLEFTLKKGAHDLLFMPEYMAIAHKGKNATSFLVKLGLLKGQTYPVASEDQGTADGYIGMNSEDADLGGFSLALGDKKASGILFLLFVEKIQIVDKAVGSET